MQIQRYGAQDGLFGEQGFRCEQALRLSWLDHRNQGAVPRPNVHDVRNELFFRVRKCFSARSVANLCTVVLAGRIRT
jgi:hypothetical protein